jgi:hypothetical protein
MGYSGEKRQFIQERSYAHGNGAASPALLPYIWNVGQKLRSAVASVKNCLNNRARIVYRALLAGGWTRNTADGLSLAQFFNSSEHYIPD